jgi:7-keto-8-aminopelargonate synthetase-like enzyme
MDILNGPVGTSVTVEGRQCLFFAGNNYLGLANHPAVKRAAVEAIERHGLSCSASRETTGTFTLHLELERLLAEFKGRPAAAIFASGYQGNKILLDALGKRVSTVFLDRFSHPSILDGIPRKVGEIVTYNHCDVDHLAGLLDERPGANALIITDGLFALTGEIAPLDRMVRLAGEHRAIVVVDDAHATGILGETGRGTPEHFGLDGAADLFQTETMSKAFGSYGGFIASTTDIVESIRNNSAAYIGSTALPPPIVGASIASLRHFRRHPELRLGVLDNARYIKEELRRMNFSTVSDHTPIIPLFFDTPKKAERLSRFLYDQGIIGPAMKYPVPMDRYLVRLTVSADHTKEQMDTLLEALERWRNRHGRDHD